MITFKQYLQEAKQNTISQKDPVRKAVQKVIEQIYWDKPGYAITAIQEALDKHDYEIDQIISFNDNLEDYRHTYPLVRKIGPPDSDQRESIDNVLVFSWHKMGSGRYEIVAYIS